MTAHEPQPQLPEPLDFYLSSGAPQVVSEFPVDAEHGAVYYTPPTVTRDSEEWYELSSEGKIDQLDRRIALLSDIGKVSSGYMEHLKVEAMTDTLTGLKNRRGYILSLNNRIKAGQGDVAISFIDLDNFKEVNDTQGHAGGDKLLKKVADRVQKVVHLREGDEIFRLGGDEFVIIYGTDNKKNGRRQQRKQDKAIKGFEVRIIKEVEVAAFESNAPFVSASIGTVRRRIDETAESFLNRADEAMYLMKRARNSVRIQYR